MKNIQAVKTKCSTQWSDSIAGANLLHVKEHSKVLIKKGTIDMGIMLFKKLI